MWKLLSALGVDWPQTGTIETAGASRAASKGPVGSAKYLLATFTPTATISISLPSTSTQRHPVQIVCGAPQRGRPARGSRHRGHFSLYYPEGEEFKIKKSKIRRRESLRHDMRRRRDRHRRQPRRHHRPARRRQSRPGLPAADYYGPRTTMCSEVDLTPNRIDAASHPAWPATVAAALTAAAPHLP